MGHLVSDRCFQFVFKSILTRFADRILKKNDIEEERANKMKKEA
jgi:hypothetical protein